MSKHRRVTHRCSEFVHLRTAIVTPLTGDAHRRHGGWCPRTDGAGGPYR
jgi:hypothetical protein